MRYLLFILIIFLTCSLPIKEQSSKNQPRSLGMNLAGIADWSTEYPFLDFVKSSRKWISQKKNTQWGKGGELEINSKGWIKTLKEDQFADLIFVTVAKDMLPYEIFIVKYEGEGEIQYSLNAKLVSQDKQNRIDTIKVDSSRDGYGILSIRRTNPQDPIRNIKIVPEKYFKNFKAGEILNPDWKEKLRPFSTLRFMDWMKTNGSLVDNWQVRPVENQISYAYASKGREEGVPIEIMILASNELKSDPWFNMPHLANDNYIKEFAKLTKSKLQTSRKIYVEHSNEVWNWQFAQSHSSLKKAEERWGKKADGFMQWHGMRTAQICKIWKQVFGNDPKRVVCVFGTQAAYKGIEKVALECPLYVQEGNEPCYKSFDAYSIASYFSAGLGGSNNPNTVKVMESWMQSKDGGIEKAFEQLRTSKYFEAFDSLKNLKENYAYHKSVADKHKLSMIAYEGGQHITGNGQSTQNLNHFTEFYTKLNRHPTMGKVYEEHINNWYESGGSLFMHFSDIGISSKYGSWGALESLGQKDSPKWKALLKFVKEK